MPYISRIIERSAFLVCIFCVFPAWAAVIEVPTDQPTVQAGLDAAGPGDAVELTDGVYFEKVEFPASGLLGSSIELRAKTGHSPILDGTGVSGANMILIDSKSYVQVSGLEIRNNTGVTDGSGIRILGGGAGIEIRDNTIHDILGRNAMGITVYGTSATAVEDLVIDGNEIYDCEPSPSEALVLNGNVTDWQVTNNYVHDVNNIAIDFIGGETDIQPNPALVARNGTASDNLVARCGSGFSGGLYCDGCTDVVIENNTVTECDLGIEVAAENAGNVTTGVTVRNNVLYANRVVGIIFGGFSAGVGRANANVFRGNTLYKNATDASDGAGEIWVQFGDDNVIEHNIVYARSVADGGVPNTMVASYNASSGNTFNYNLYFTEDGAGSAEFGLDNSFYTGFGAWQTSGEDAASVFADPLLVDAAGADFHISSASPAVDAGDPAFTPELGETDMDGSPREVGAAVDIGADEATCGDTVVQVGEDCDDGNATKGDGCDSNCTVSACGNGVVAPGEDCDDGNTDNGDCCDSACQADVGGTSCDDGVACTYVDECDGAGTCVGALEPDPVCTDSAAGKSKLLLKDSGNKDLLKWVAKADAEVTLAELDDPSAATDYQVCVFVLEGATATAAFGAEASAGSKWAAKGTKGFKYKDRDLVPDGLQQVALQAGAAGKGKFKIKGKGANLSLFPLGFGAGVTSVVVQLRSSDGFCVGAVHDAPFSKNTADQLKARN